MHPCVEMQSNHSQLTLHGHLAEQLVCQLLWEDQELAETQGPIGAFHTEPV